MRDKFNTRTINLVSQIQVETLINLAKNLPLDPDNPLEVVIREKPKVRGMDANARMWAGTLKDIAEQAWVNGRQYSAEVWHEYFKKEYLPENDDPDLEILAKEGYQKWTYTPAGDRILIGTTTKLLKKGFAEYLQKVEAFGGSMGVEFRVVDRFDVGHQ